MARQAEVGGTRGQRACDLGLKPPLSLFATFKEGCLTLMTVAAFCASESASAVPPGTVACLGSFWSHRWQSSVRRARTTVRRTDTGGRIIVGYYNTGMLNDEQSLDACACVWSCPRHATHSPYERTKK